MYAIIETGSKQYKVKEGDIIRVELLKIKEGDKVSLSKVDEGDKVSIDKVLAFSNGTDFTAGAPYIAGATVDCSVLGNGKHKKVIIYKFKAKKGYHKKKGHRQPYTELKIEKINA